MKRLTDQIDYTPIPKEYMFFREDGKQDNDIPNRFYFNLPADWCTADKGETIIGFRTIWMLARRRKLEFNIKVRKYFRNDTSKVSQVECNIVSFLKLPVSGRNYKMHVKLPVSESFMIEMQMMNHQKLLYTVQ